MSTPPSGGRSVDIATVLRDAHFGTLRWLNEERRPYDDLYGATERLFDLLAERRVEFVLVGGLAMLQYVDGRNTSDIDLIMAVPDLDRVPELHVGSHDADFARAEFEGIQVDLLLTSNALFERVAHEYTTVRQFSGRELPCATPEGLLILKLFALPSLYRQGDGPRIALYEADLRMLLEQYDVDTEAVLGQLNLHLLASDVAELRRLTGELRAKIARVQARPFDKA